ncbi:IS66 family insertion sequence element accessory protein TnpB [Endozoicomonas ascidiicola]|uniref:IS66 family insertion sequence element accessory protein TnpB n=1 Tax=Endozoicomonas ascidiicola TaxID=1698521 RepID=UPI00082BC450|nr:IS66 family insertion sequence element accessory protein TnpB [Endozoicomonas ascidiicola]
MFFPESQVRVWLYNHPTDMRKSYNGLVALAKNTLEEDPLSGQLFVFFNRRRNQCKVLYFERGGYCIWSKRLEQGQFHARASQAVKQLLALTDLKLIIEGIDTRSIRYHKRYEKPDVSTSKVPD